MIREGLSTIVTLVAGTVLAGILVNRFAPQKRHRMRRIVFLGGAYLLLLAFGQLAESFGMPKWSTRATLGADLCCAFAFVNLAATILFDTLLPLVGIVLLSITTDLLVGLSYILVTMSVLRGAGLNPTEIVATGAVVSAVVAISLQGTLGNVIGGVALQVDGSINVGDWIQLENGRQGRVTKIRWRHIVLETRDYSTIIMPNSALLSSQFTVLGRRGGRAVPQRMWVHFHVDHRFSPARVLEVVTDALQGDPIANVAEEPKPNVVCLDFAHERRTSFALYAARYWIKDLAHDDPTNSAVRVRIYAALKRAGIPLAIPATAVFLTKENEGREERHAKREHSSRVAALRAVELFASLSETEVETLADHLRFAPFAAGETMTRQGAVAHWLYIMTKGRAEVRTTVEDSSKLVNTLEAPAFFGEMGLMTGEARLASVVALTEVDCFRLDKEGFERILRDRPEIAKELSHLLAERRVQLASIRENLSAAQKATRMHAERERILSRIQEFFGL